MEQVPMSILIDVLQKRKERKPEWYDFEVIVASDFGVPQKRRRVLAGDPQTIRRLRSNRDRANRSVSVRAAFDAESKPLPSEWIMNSTTNQPLRDKEGRGVSGFRKMRPEEHTRSIDEPAYTVLARHALRWVQQDGSVVRPLTPEEGARLQSFPHGYFLGHVHKQRLVGNALSPLLALSLFQDTHHRT
jgi:site-specific DNA-cytosine methylase